MIHQHSLVAETLARLRQLVVSAYSGRDDLYAAARQLTDQDLSIICRKLADDLGGNTAVSRADHRDTRRGAWIQRCRRLHIRGRNNAIASERPRRSRGRFCRTTGTERTPRAIRCNHCRHTRRRDTIGSPKPEEGCGLRRTRTAPRRAPPIAKTHLRAIRKATIRDDGGGTAHSARTAGLRRFIGRCLSAGSE